MGVGGRRGVELMKETMELSERLQSAVVKVVVI